MYKKYAITFGGGKQAYLDAATRLKKQIESLNVFDEVISFTPDDLKKDDTFWEQHGNFIELNKKGYGYWIWKSYIINSVLGTMNEGDILFYADSGCEAHARKRDYLLQSINRIETDSQPIYFSKLRGSKFRESRWTKNDVFDKIDISSNNRVKRTAQNQAGILLIRKCAISEELISEWDKLTKIDNYHLVDDTPSSTPNHHGFMQHRHDQSILSVLLKKKGYVVDENRDMEKAIYCIRNRTGSSRIL